MPEERVFTFDVASEIDRYFDASSFPQGEKPQIIILMGGPAGGKTTIRKQRYSTGYVLVDAAEIFLSLSRGEFFPFPEAFEEPMNIIGSLVARRAIAERRHIVTEIIGSDYEATKALIDAFLTIGYRPDIQAITCDLAEATRRNASRGDDCISACYAEPYQRRWLLQAAQGPGDPDAQAPDRGPDAAAESSIFDYVDPLCIIVSRTEVDRNDLEAPLATLRHLTSSLDMVRQFRERVDISFDGYMTAPKNCGRYPPSETTCSRSMSSFLFGSIFYRVIITDYSALAFVCCPRFLRTRRAFAFIPNEWLT